MKRLVVAALLIGGCAAGPQGERAAASATAAAPNHELAVLETEFRARDRELGELLTEVPSPDCYRIEPLFGELGGLTLKICEISTTRDARHSMPGVPCRYARARNVRLSAEARRIGCKRSKDLRVMPSATRGLSPPCSSPSIRSSMKRET